MARKKYKLKPDVYLYLIVIIVIIIMCSKGIKAYKKHKYEQTTEYKLISAGYSKKEINVLNKYYSDNELIKLSKKKYDKNLIELISNKNYFSKYHDDYLSYMDLNPRLTVDEVINNVNLHLNYSFYEKTFEADLSKNNLTLVNKYYHLSEDYEPDDLAVISTKYSWGTPGSQKIRNEVLEAFIKMHEDAEINDIYLMVNRSYKSYSDLKKQFDNYVNIHGEESADKDLIRPGYNERQLGLTLDILSLKDPTQNTFKDSDTYKWLSENAYKYGFILRYPEGKEKITGTEFISWIYRYVGVEAATIIHNDNITFEEYYTYYIDK